MLFSAATNKSLLWLASTGIYSFGLCECKERPTIIRLELLEGSVILQKARPGQRTSVHFGLLHMVCLPLVKPTLFSCPWQSVNRGHSVKEAALEESPWSTGLSIDGTNTCYGPGSVIWTSLNIQPFHMWNVWDYPWWNPTNLWCQSVDKNDCAGSIPYCYAEGHSLKCSKLCIIALYSVFALWIKLCFVLVSQSHSLPLSKQNHCLKWRTSAGRLTPGE